MGKSDSQTNLELRVSLLEKGMGEMDGKIDTIMTNHLPHVNIAIEKLSGVVNSNSSKLNAKMNYVTITNIAAIVLGIVVLRFFQ